MSEGRRGKGVSVTALVDSWSHDGLLTHGSDPLWSSPPFARSSASAPAWQLDVSVCSESLGPAHTPRPLWHLQSHVTDTSIASLPPASPQLDTCVSQTGVDSVSPSPIPPSLDLNVSVLSLEPDDTGAVGVDACVGTGDGAAVATPANGSAPVTADTAVILGASGVGDVEAVLAAWEGRRASARRDRHTLHHLSDLHRVLCSAEVTDGNGGDEVFAAIAALEARMAVLEARLRKWARVKRAGQPVLRQLALQLSQWQPGGDGEQW